MSQVRGLGQARPAVAASSGTSTASVGRTRMNPPTQLRATTIQRSHLSGKHGIRGVGHPPESPSATALPSIVQSRWQSRFARGAESSDPDAACSGGFAAATTATPAEQLRSPTYPLEHHPQQGGLHSGRGGGDLVENRMPSPAVASRWAQRGGAKSTREDPPSWLTMGRPAKSDGSRIEAITVSEGRLKPRASDLITDVLPVPGDPQRSTGTRAGLPARAPRQQRPDRHPPQFGLPLMGCSSCAPTHRSGDLPPPHL